LELARCRARALVPAAAPASGTARGAPHRAESPAARERTHCARARRSRPVGGRDGSPAPRAAGTDGRARALLGSRDLARQHRRGCRARPRVARAGGCARTRLAERARPLMKERLITLGCALGALALFLTIFVRSENAADARRDIPRPTSEERRGNGYHAAMSWLDQERTRTASLRNRFDRLADQPGLAPAGNLLIVTLPASVGFRTEEFRPLERWVRAGKPLLVLAALADRPAWAI